MDILPYIITSLSAIGTFEGILRFINSRKMKRYIGYGNQIIRILDSILAENPNYSKTQLDHILNLAIDISNDGKLSLKDYAPLKEYIISNFDIREYQSKKQNPQGLSQDENNKKDQIKRNLSIKND